MGLKYYFNFTLFVLFAFGVVKASSFGSSSCNFNFNLSNASYILQNSSCSEISLFFSKGVSNVNVSCENLSFGGSSHIIFEGSNNKDFLFNCTFAGANISVGNNSNPGIISPKSKVFNLSFLHNSSISVGYILNISVFEPFGANSVSGFGKRVGAFAYIVPTFNNTIHINNTQLQMDPWFSQHMINIFNSLNKSVPFGLYWINQTQIFENISERSYGNIFGYKKFILPEYTITVNSIINYNPYAVEYSFLGYDQLVMYLINITKDINLMPVYIQPIYPGFNYNIIPNNGKRNMTIKWLVAVPPPDYNWNFSAYIYRYSTPLGFIMNPLNNSLPNGTAIVKMLSYPSQNWSLEQNGTYIYYLNYTSQIGIGLNSSIVLLPGYIPHEGKFIQDSTTPSFSYGLGFCSTQYNSTNVVSYISESGFYNMTSKLLPISPYAPVFVNAPCYIGGYIIGSNILINCGNGSINSTYFGFIINHAKNVTLENCNIYGNGFLIMNSSLINIFNVKINSTSLANSTGLEVYNSSDIFIKNVTIGKGFSKPYIENNSLNVSFYNATNATNSSSQSMQPLSKTGIKLSQKIILYSAAIVLVIAYIYVFFKIQYKPRK